MKKVTVIEFDKNYGARIHINPDNLEELIKKPNCVVDPDLREVRGLSPCFWKRSGHAAVPMGDAEMEEVRENFAALGQPHSLSDLRRMRRMFISKNVFRKFLQREREDFQFLIVRESKLAASKMDDMIARVDNLLSYTDQGFADYLRETNKRFYNHVCYRINVIIFLLLSLIMMGVIYGWHTK